MARPARLERATLCLEGRRSIQLSYGRAFPNFSHHQELRHNLVRFVKGIVHSGRAGNKERNTTERVAGLVAMALPG